MRLTEVAVQDFRNLASARVVLSERLNLLFGANGQGKTNFLEAVWFLATQRPLRAPRLADLVRWGKQTAEVQGKVVEEITTHLSVRIHEGRREGKVDGKTPSSLESWADALKVVAFTPDDLELAKGSPAGRRAWIDRAVFTRRPGQLRDHRAYARALKARNRLLKDARRRAVSSDELAAFDETLVVSGARLLRRRLELVDELAPRARTLYEAVTRSGLPLEVRYRSEVLPEAPPRDEAGLTEALREALARRLSQDRARGFTTAGPHADDVDLRLAGREVRTFASQGQQRAVVLSLKIAEIENLRATLGRTPILLLDDVSSELDADRNAQLLDYLGRFPGQVVLTTTDPAHAPAPAGVPVHRFRVQGGAIGPL